MSPKIKSLAARFGEHQRKFIAAGGKPKALKYPEAWRLEAARLTSELKVPIAAMARELGVGHSALQRWCEKVEPANQRPRKKAAGPAFVPIEVMTGGRSAPVGGQANAAARVTLREITIDVAPDAEGGAVAALIATLARGGKGESC